MGGSEGCLIGFQGRLLVFTFGAGGLLALGFDGFRDHRKFYVSGIFGFERWSSSVSKTLEFGSRYETVTSSRFKTPLQSL